MSPRTADCPHELRPGLTVCLHCRRAEREAKGAHRRRILAKTTFGIVGFGVCVSIGYFGANSFESGGVGRGLLASAANLVSRAQAAVPRSARRTNDAPSTPAVSIASPGHAPPAQTPPGQFVLAVGDSSTFPGASSLATASVATMAVAALAVDSAPQGPPSAPATTTQDLPLTGSPLDAPAPAAPPAVPPTGTPATLSPVVAVAAPAAPRYAPTIVQGRTELGGDGMYATREGDVVRVYFDTELGRTRRADKFEQIVRATLPRVLGTAADSLLRQLPAGRIASSGDLIADLPHRGVELRHLDGRTLTIWPETRPGRDGPLVISYRVTLK